MACLEPPKEKPLGGEALAEQWYVLVECRDEKQQVELLRRFKREGLTCKAALAWESSQGRRGQENNPPRLPLTFRRGEALLMGCNMLTRP